MKLAFVRMCFVKSYCVWSKRVNKHGKYETGINSRPTWSTAVTETLFTKLALVKLLPWRPARAAHSVTRRRTEAHSFIESRMPDSRSRWLCGLRRVSAATNFLGLRFEPRREHGCLHCTVRTEDRKPGQTSMDEVQSTREYKKKKKSPEAWLFVFCVLCVM